MKQRYNWSCLMLFLGFALGGSHSLARLDFNEKSTPDSIEEIKAIEAALKTHLERTRQATVCITNGQGFGTGVIVSKEGLVMTAAHVTAGVDKEFKVIMEDGTEYEAKSLGLDSETDAALLKITEKKEFPFVVVEDKPQSRMTTRLGDWVYSLGHAGGFDKARGSVVRLGRIVRLNHASATLQSDCKLIGGDSGGPLFNMEGILVGIHSRVGVVLDQNMHVASYDFFKPDKDGVKKWDRLLASEFLGLGPFAQRPVKGGGFIGVAVEEVEEGLKITDLDETAPAHEEGVLVGDVLLSINGEEMKTKKALVDFLKQRTVGEKIHLKLNRAGEIKEYTVALVQR